MKGNKRLSTIFLLVLAGVLPVFSQGSQPPVSKAVQNVSNKWTKERAVEISSTENSIVSSKEVQKVAGKRVSQRSTNVISTGDQDWTISKAVNLIHRRKK